MKILAYGLLLTSVFISTQALAEDFSVVIKERGSGVAVESATVVLLKAAQALPPNTETDDTVISFAETDKMGQVQFSDIELPVNIKVLAPGYETQLHPLTTRRPTYQIYLTPVEMEGEAIVVTANRIVESTSRISLDAEELTKSAGSGSDPLKAITALPGIIETSESSSRVYMRGSGSSDNIIWVNRAPVGYLYHFGGFQSTIHPALIEDINVFLAGFPVEYGDALGGVIDAKLRQPKNDRKHSYFDISTIASSFMVEGPAGETDGYYVAGRRSYIDAILSPQDFNDAFEDEDEDDPDQFTLVPRFYDFQSLYHHQLERGSIDTYLFAAGDKLALDIRGSAASDPQLAGALQNKSEYQTLGTTWRQGWNEAWDHVMVLAWYHNEEYLRVGRDENGDPFFIDVSADTLLWQPEIHYSPNTNNTLSMGMAASYVKAPVNLYISPLPDEDDPDFDFTSQNKYRLNKTLYVHAAEPYVKHRLQWTPSFATTLGAYFSNVHITGGFRANETSPRASMEYRLSDATLLSASWGRYLQVPSGTEIIENFGNPALEMTEAEHRVLGIEHSFSDLYSVKAEIYRKPMKNLVIFIDENTAPDNYVNAGTGDAYGVDIFLKREHRDKTFGWLALSWSKSERTNEITHITHDFIGDRPWTFTAVWGQPFSATQWKRWDWSIKAQVNSGTPYTPVIGRHLEDPDDPNSRWIADYAEQNSKRTPTYYKVDLRIGRNILLRESKLKLYLDMQNVTFAENIVEYDYGNEYEKIDKPTEIKGLSFFPYFGVELEF